MKCCIVLLSLCLFPSLALSQSTDATISGGVTDPTGNLIQNAEVEIANDATGVLYAAQTNNSGMYLVPVLPPGHYHVQVSKRGFKTIIKADVILYVQSAVALNFVLPVGATSESITVNSATPALNTTDASVSTVVDQKFVENIPLNGRSFQDLISMTPGVVTASPQNTSQGVGTSGDFSVNGQRTQSNYYTVDGVSANISAGSGNGISGAATGGTLSGSTALGTTQTMVPVDALQEFRVQSSTYSAEYGRSPGGQFSLLSRSGTNIPHGSAYDYLRNNFFDANDWFNDHYGDPQPALRQNDFGGTLGGPVWIPHLYDGRNRGFFFVAYEGLRLTLPTAASIQYVPDLFMRQQAVSAMQPILDAFPLPNGIDYGTASSPSLAQFISPFSLPSSIDSTSVRLDHTFGPKLALFFRYGYTPSSTESRPNFARTTGTSDAQTFTFGASSQLSSKLANEFRLEYARSTSAQIGVLDDFGGATPVNLAAAMGASGYSRVNPVVVMSLAGGNPTMDVLNSLDTQRQWNVVDTVSVLKGHHTFKVGVDYRHIKSPITPPNVEPYIYFDSSQQLLSGSPDFPDVSRYLPATPLFNQTALFAEDEWRLARSVSLSYGLRWELSPPPTEQHGNDAYTLDGNIGDPASLTVAPQGTPLWKTAWYNFAPRLGVAWTAHDQPGLQTVLRAGGGVFFDSLNEVATLGYSGLGFRADNVETGATIPFTPSELNIPITVGAPYTAATITAFPTHMQLPYTLEWNVSLQQALGASQSMTISYVGANGRRLTGLQEDYLTALNPNFGSVDYFQSGVTSNYQALQVQFQRSVAKGIQALVAYTWSHAIDFGSNATVLPLQRADADFDVRNNFQAGMSWELPKVTTGHLVEAVLNDWALDARLNVRTAFPITLGGAPFIDPATGTEYPGTLNVVPGQPFYLYGSQYPGGKAINPAAFSLPLTGVLGNAPRNHLRGFGETQLNLAIRRDIPLHNRVTLRFRAEAFNLLNHPNFGYIDPMYTDATFGQAISMLNTSLGTVASQYQQGGARSMQFALKLVF
jgi:Carboxypeptidase regulatory-like domain/TonB-dependent Receptor Plug Domain